MVRSSQKSSVSSGRIILHPGHVPGLSRSFPVVVMMAHNGMRLPPRSSQTDHNPARALSRGRINS